MKLSVCMITYNHEKYIAQAIEGCLMQKTDFPVEIVIGEDCSTDKTRSICLEYKNKYPDKIKLLLPEKNLGMMGNLVETLNACDGEFVAWCEGDDYWTDPKKLQKQVDFLDANKEYAICSHGVQIVHQNADKQPQIWSRKWIKNKEATIEDIIVYGGGATCSLIWRNKIFGELPDWFSEQKGGDWSLQILCASKGKMKYIPDVMGVYRIHNNGSHQARFEEAKKNNINFVGYLYDNMKKMIDAIDTHFNRKYSGLFEIARNYNHLRVFDEYFARGDFENSKKHVKFLFVYLQTFSPLVILKIITKLIIIYLPKTVIELIRNTRKI